MMVKYPNSGSTHPAMRKGDAMRTIIVFGLAIGISYSFLQAQPVFLTQPASKVVWVGAKVTLAASTSAQTPATFHWLINATNLPSGLEITTMAGNGTFAYTGDGGPATSATLKGPFGMALDSVGDLFIADVGNGCIRKVDTNGIITTVAGNGTNGFSGDGGNAKNAMLNQPQDVALDAVGNMYIADTVNIRIRKVDTNGVISTIAGNGTSGYSGDGGSATNAMLYSPQFLAMDAAGNLFTSGFLAEGAPSYVRKVDTNGIITTVAGNGTNGFSGDGGAATNAELSGSLGLAVDVVGDLFIADFFNYRIRKVDTNGIITTFAGNGGNSYSGDGGQATNAGLARPLCVAVDPAGNLFFSEADMRIREVDTNGIISTLAGNGGFGYSGDGGIATNTSLDYPVGLAVDAADDLFIAGLDDSRIRQVVSANWPNAMKSSLVLNPATLANAGNYQEIITAGGISVTSSVASLTVVTSPMIYQTVPQSGGKVALSFVSLPGSTNVVLGATNLLPPVNWLPLSTNVAGVDGDWQFTDVNASGNPVNFYRSLTR